MKLPMNRKAKKAKKMKIADIFITYGHNNEPERYGVLFENNKTLDVSEDMYNEIEETYNKYGDFGHEFDTLRQCIIENITPEMRKRAGENQMIEPCEEWFNDYNPDQTAKADKGKPRLSLVPTEIINCIARVREYGVTKYVDVDNWKRVEVERYRDALFRHLIAYINDPKSVDEESGLPHLWHCATNCAFLCELEKDK